MRLRLVDGEQVVVRTRAHRRTLLPALLTLLVTVALMSFLLGYVSRGSQPEVIRHYSHVLSTLVVGAGALTLVFGTLRPVLAWANQVTWLTDLRVVRKNLLGAPQPVIVPLGLLAEAQLKQTRLQAMSGAGDLVLHHGAYGQQQRTVLADTPDAEHLHTVLAEELGAYRRAAAAQHARRAREAAVTTDRGSLNV